MNAHDTLRQIAPPPECAHCLHDWRERGADGKWRYECLRIKARHPECGYFKSLGGPLATSPVAQPQGPALVGHPVEDSQC